MVELQIRPHVLQEKRKKQKQKQKEKQKQTK